MFQLGAKRSVIKFLLLVVCIACVAASVGARANRKPTKSAARGGGRHVPPLAAVKTGYLRDQKTRIDVRDAVNGSCGDKCNWVFDEVCLP